MVFLFLLWQQFPNIHCARASASANECMTVCVCVRHAKSANFSHQLWIIALHNCDLALVQENKKETERDESRKNFMVSLDRILSE